MRWALLRAASNNPYAVGRSYYTFDVSARNRGLCPHMKNHPLCGWMIIVYRKPQARPVVPKSLSDKEDIKNSFCYTESAVGQLHKE